jgi:methylmalonyl-CoA/ethylmalonyl-CoA epimerase
MRHYFREGFFMLKFDHVGYLVRSADGKKHLMEDLLGLQFRHRLIREQADNTNVLDFYEFDGGSIELVESSNPDSMYNRFIAERGEGIHHIAFQVEDLRQTMAEWKTKGVRFTMDPPLGASGSRRAIITFTDPETSDGLVIELCQQLAEGEENPCWVQK